MSDALIDQLELATTALRQWQDGPQAFTGTTEADLRQHLVPLLCELLESLAARAVATTATSAPALPAASPAADPDAPRRPTAESSPADVPGDAVRPDTEDVAAHPAAGA